MAFDIFGERLTPGHCDVHPWIADEYPCFQCMAESKAKLAGLAHQRAQQNAAWELDRIENSDEQSDPGVI